MKEIDEIEILFNEARQNVEFEFVLTLINYRGMGTKKLMTNLYEWFDAIEFYKTQYNVLQEKEKVRIGLLLYSTFFENSDFYNIIGSLCKIKLGYKGSAYLFHKTRKLDRLLGTGEKIDMILELLIDADKKPIIDFFKEVHVKQLRNTFFHSAYSISDTEYILHDSEPIQIGNMFQGSVSINDFIYPRIERVINFFDEFKRCYLSALNSYTEDKEVFGLFPEPTNITILGSQEGLRGFRIKNAVQFYGEWHDSGIEYDEQYDMWAGLNIQMNFADKASVEIHDQIRRYSEKQSIRLNNAEFQNLVDKVIERSRDPEIATIVELLVRFGNDKYAKMQNEENPHKKKSMPRIILSYYEQAKQHGDKLFDMKEIDQRIKELYELIEE